MCLVLLALQAHPDVPLLLAGNRDEYHSRPAAPPAVIQYDPRIYAGRDLEAGGTWMGRNEHGMMAALTNRHVSPRPAPRNVQSRGGIVTGLLQHARLRDARAWLEGLDMATYRPFNVLFGDAGRFYYFTSEERQPPREIAPGFHALSNYSLDDQSWPKVARSLNFLQQSQERDGEALLTGMQLFLGDATQPDDLQSDDPTEEIHGALGAVFIRSPGYGTVSSTILTSGGTLGERYYYAEGKRLGENPAGAFERIDFDL
ncbi:MAG: NRDE family protein [SAR324 cluster bacterium]|nr:NRDE family protein [SAR324 cluster bacterium]MCZ6730287.1 NRDE family protein [SAR324 cluster bacterium]